MSIKVGDRIVTGVTPLNAKEIFEKEVLSKVCPVSYTHLDVYKRQALRVYSIDPEKCRGCTLCMKVCPVGAISGERRKPHSIDATKCIKCGACVEKCRFGAINH